MAMPLNRLSQVTIRYAWRGVDQPDPGELKDYDLGGIALNDPSEGLEYQLWTFSAVDDKAYAMAPNLGEPILLLTAPGDITDITGTFDQNMAPFVGYKANGQWSYWWFDPVTHTQTTSQLPSNVDSCRVCYDDRRKFEAPQADILLNYTLNGNLYQRRQRDRYTQDLLIRESVHGKLIRVDLNAINRLQFKLESDRL